VSARNNGTDAPYTARVPADVEAPDRVVWGLTARQVAILAAAAAVGYLVLRAAGGRVPVPVLAVALVPLAGVAVAVALGRRDGLPLDAWLLAAVGYRRSARRLVPVAEGVVAPPLWVAPDVLVEAAPAPLALPARAVSDHGVVDLGDGAAAVLVAAATVNIGLRTGAEQTALVAGYARWLNGLTGPVQVVVSAQRVDLASHAGRIADAADRLPDPGLADAARDHAAYLLDLAAHRDPLCRTVTIACPAGADRGGAVDATRRARHTAAALAALGAQTRVLDAGTATAVLTAAADPYQPTDPSWPRATPQQPVTAAYRPAPRR
jgi:hypothetical protein